MNVLLLVDLQNDFLSGGALAVPNGDEVIPVANKLINSGKFDLIVASQDWHPADHGSFASNQNAEPFTMGELAGMPQVLWPNHCVQESYGARFSYSLKSKKVNTIFRKGMDPTVDSYSAFFDNGHKNPTGLGRFLDMPDLKLYCMGLATDFCLKYTVLDAIGLGFKTFVIEDGCRAVNMNAGDDEKAIAEMRNAGISIITSEDI